MTRSAEDWALEYMLSTELEHKCAPPPIPSHYDPDPSPRLVPAPGRPKELQVTRSRPRSLSPASMSEPRNRAKLLHKFWHHELQAAELMCWAFLTYAEAEPEFRKGLLRICRDEIRHMRLYQEHIEKLGYRVGDFPVRDWFWERVPTCRTRVQFVALVGMGLEAANLEHTPRFASWFAAAGDHSGALLQERIGREEIAHVRFAVRWFRRWTGGDDFASWASSLPKPLTPLLMRGKTIQREARKKAEMSDAFLDALADWRPSRYGRS